MGSSIFNYHVRSDNAATVSDRLTALMQSEGYEPIEEQSGVSESWPFSGSTRSFYLFESSQGWVGILDCDLILSSETAGQLSAALDTYSISFHVNDSDSWHYILTHRGHSRDEFNSPGAEDFEPFGAGPDDLNALLGKSGLEDFQMAVRELEGEFPPDSDEPPSNEAGLKIFSPLESDDPDGEPPDENRTQDSSNESSDDASQEPDSSEDEKSIEASPELRRHLSALKPLLVPGISQQQVLKVLSATAVFAEETLAAFLPLIGINPFFGYVDFRDMAEEINSKELKRESLRLHRRLDFEQK